MFTFTTFTLALAASANAFPIWSRFVARDASTPAQLAQGTNFYFDSLHLEDQCTSGQIACISSNLAKCSPEGNWEITPCTGNTTCLAVPSNDNGLFVQCMLFTDAQAAIGSDSVSVDQGITQPPNNTATAPAAAAPSATESTSAEPSSEPSTSTDASAEPTPTESADPTSTCTDDVDGPEATETQTITVILSPNPTQSGVFVTTTLTGDEPEVTEPVEEPEVTEPVVEDPSSTDDSGAEPTPTTPEGVAPEPTFTEVTGTDAVEPSTTEEPTATCTESPEDPEATESPADPEETDAPSDDDESSSAEPTDEITTESSTVEPTSTAEGVTLTIAPGFSAPPLPTASSSVPEVIVGGTHFIPAVPAPSTPAKMRTIRRST